MVRRSISIACRPQSSYFSPRRCRRRVRAPTPPARESARCRSTPPATAAGAPARSVSGDSGAITRSSTSWRQHLAQRRHRAGKSRCPCSQAPPPTPQAYHDHHCEPMITIGSNSLRRDGRCRAIANNAAAHDLQVALELARQPAWRGNPAGPIHHTKRNLLSVRCRAWSPPILVSAL